MSEHDPAAVTTELDTYSGKDVMTLIDAPQAGAASARMRMAMRTDAELRAAVWRARAENLALRLALVDTVELASAPPTVEPARCAPIKVATKHGRWPSIAAGLVAIIAGLAGYVVGDSRDSEFVAAAADQRFAQAIMGQTLERNVSGMAVKWTNPDSGGAGTILPVRTWRTNAGKYCREFEETLGGGPGTSRNRAVACREGPQQWRVVVRYFGI